VATERAADRAHNPGLPADHVDTVVAGCCVLLGIMRRLELRSVTIEVPA
jgi:exopolyphosphatase/guanosine-5'-triphosphate,3'-diphosphate pyrophosphatase